MQKIEILVLLKFIGQKIGFDEIQENLQLRSYEGKVLSTIIEHDGNHKLCVEVGQDECEIFDVKNLINLKKHTLWKPLFSGVDWDFVNIPRTLAKSAGVVVETPPPSLTFGFVLLVG